MELEIIFGGSGGQGILLMAELMGRAFSKTGENVLYYTSYGGEIRGGAADCFLTVSNDEIGTPIITEASVLVAMSYNGLVRYVDRVVPGGLLLINSSQVSPPPGEHDFRLASVKADELAASLGSMRSANMVALGGMIGLTGVMGLEEIVEALCEKLPPHRQGLIDINRQALAAGMEAVADQPLWKKEI